MLNTFFILEVALEQQRDRLREAEYRRLYRQARKDRAKWLRKIVTLLALLVALSPQVAQARVYDIPCQNGEPTVLIAIIEAANDSPGHDIIRLAAGCTYTLSAVAGSYNGQTGLPLISDSLTIEGNGARLERAATAPNFRLLVTAPGIPLALSNLTLANGYAQDRRTTHPQGGAIHASGPLSLTEVSVVDNYAAGEGGGVAAYGRANSVIVSGGRFENNEGGYGGGLFAEGSLLVTQASFINNQATYQGGAISAKGETVSIEASRFAGNAVSDTIALGAGFGGGLYVTGNVTLAQSQFSDNYAKAGGAISLGGGVSAFTGRASIAGGRFEGNTAENGGAIAMYNGSLHLAQSVFLNNRAEANGAGALLRLGPNSDNKVVNNLWVGQPGPTVYITGEAESLGNLEFAHNTLADPAGEAAIALEIVQAGAIRVVNNIIANYATGLVSHTFGVSSSYNLYQIANPKQAEVGPIVSIEGGTTVADQAQFVEPASGNYRLKANSPAIDQATDAGIGVDLEGIARPQIDRPDIGAYEFVRPDGTPTATNDGYTTASGTTLTVAEPGVLGNDTAVAGGSLFATLETGPAHGTLTLDENGRFSYVPEPGFAGEDSFVYLAGQKFFNPSQATVQIQVEQQSQPAYTVFLPLVQK